MFNSNIPDDILRQYAESNDFGFSAVDSGTAATEDNVEISLIKEKLDQILQMNATCDGAMAVKTQYEWSLDDDW